MLGVQHNVWLVLAITTYYRFFQQFHNGLKPTTVGSTLPNYVSNYINCCCRFKEGLSTLGVLNEVQRYPSIMQDVFVHNKTELDATTVEDLFSVNWSLHGSNRFMREKVTQTHWRDFLQDSEGIQVNSCMTVRLAYEKYYLYIVEWTPVVTAFDL